jgi:aspartyl/asparaginyl-tRNA synthetase
MEISSGGQRIHIPDLLIERLKAKGVFLIDPDEILPVKFMTKKIYC